MERLVILCEVCTQPKIVQLEEEKWILASIAIQCPFCFQYSKIPNDLKQNIRRRWGMFNEQN